MVSGSAACSSASQYHKRSKIVPFARPARVDAQPGPPSYHWPEGSAGAPCWVRPGCGAASNNAERQSSPIVIRLPSALRLLLRRRMVSCIASLSIPRGEQGVPARLHLTRTLYWVAEPVSNARAVTDFALPLALE